MDVSNAIQDASADVPETGPKNLPGRYIDTCRIVFAVSVSLILFLTALAKLVAVTRGEQFLVLADPVFQFLTTRDMLIIAALIEFGVAGFIMLNRKKLTAMVASSWLVAIFVSYRMLKVAFFAVTPCRCLGGILDWTGLSPEFLDILPKALLWCIGMGSLFFLLCAIVLQITTTKHLFS